MRGFFLWLYVNKDRTLAVLHGIGPVFMFPSSSEKKVDLFCINEFLF